MSSSTHITTSMILITYAFVTGCNGYTPSSDDITEVRSILEDLNIINTQDSEISTPEITIIHHQNTSSTTENTTTENQESTESQQLTDTQKTSHIITSQLTWEPAGFYEDGSIMINDDIAHYQIVFGTSKDNLQKSIDISIAGLLTYDFAAVADSTLFVGVKAISIYGGESAVSELIEFNI